MKRFERNYNRWIDGKMSEDERLAFEAKLDANLLQAGRNWPKLRASLRTTMSEVRIPYPDFINERIRQEILHSGSPSLQPWMGLRSLAWAGACSLLAAALITFFLIPREFGFGRSFASQVISMRAENQALSAYTFPAPDQHAAVIWIEGIDYIPSEEQL